MDYVKLEKAKAEAKRFLEAAGKVNVVMPSTRVRIEEGTKESAACRRASMDLTRALAELRKG